MPRFIFNLLESEIRKIQMDLLKQVEKEYDLDIDYSKMLGPLKIVSGAETTMEIKRKNRRLKPAATPENRCVARIWNHGEGGQCTRPKKYGDFCHQHQMPDKRPHGIMSEESPIKPKTRKTQIYKAAAAAASTSA